jgi:GNAT superfamily N-acetyltransferase
MGITQFSSRRAHAGDAAVLAEVLEDGFATYRSWARPSWDPPRFGAEEVAGLADVLGREDVWCLLALHDSDVVGHVALAPFTREEPQPAPIGTTYLWQLFVRLVWQGRGVATWLMDEAVSEAQRRGFGQLLLWTPRGAAQARRFYEREGWLLTGQCHEHSGFGLPTVEYRRAVDTRVSSGGRVGSALGRRTGTVDQTAALRAE